MPALPTHCSHPTFQCLAAFKLSAEAEWQRARALSPGVFGHQLQTLRTYLGKDSKGKQVHLGVISSPKVTSRPPSLRHILTWTSDMQNQCPRVAASSESQEHTALYYFQPCDRV